VCKTRDELNSIGDENGETKTGTEKSTDPCTWKIKSSMQNGNRDRENEIEE
jgi:hypothetical protein